MTGTDTPNDIVPPSINQHQAHTQTLLEAISTELANASHDCGSLQVLISSLLDKTDHPDLVAEFHMIQDLDRVNQTLSDLALLVQSLARSLDQREIQMEAIAKEIKLASLRSRLFPDVFSSEDGPSNQVTFF